MALYKINKSCYNIGFVYDLFYGLFLVESKRDIQKWLTPTQWVYPNLRFWYFWSSLNVEPDRNIWGILALYLQYSFWVIPVSPYAVND